MFLCLTSLFVVSFSKTLMIAVSGLLSLASTPVAFSLCLRMFPLHFLRVVTAPSTLYALTVLSTLPFCPVHRSRSCFLCCQSPSRPWTLSILEFLPTCFPFWSFLSKMFTAKHSFSSAPPTPSKTVLVGTWPLLSFIGLISTFSPFSTLDLWINAVQLHLLTTKWTGFF